MNKPAPVLVKAVFKVAEFIWNIMWKFGYDGLKLTLRNIKTTDKGTNYGTLTIDGYCYWFIMVEGISNFSVAKQVSFVIPQNHKEFFEDSKMNVMDKAITEGNIT